MKFLVAILTVAGLLVGCGQQQQEAPAKAETVAIKVETAKCEACVGTITDALKGVEGVQKAEVDLEKKLATVQFIPAKVDLQKLETAVVNAGYDANDKKRNPAAYEQLPDCCK
ncbi:MAG TPA: heavy-metal-associated domain-containing protein [Bacteroidota bacterium]|nr:heavy-metal-associated domain-containing protein [Bacteroidota bacterium]